MLAASPSQALPPARIAPTKRTFASITSSFTTDAPNSKRLQPSLSPNPLEIKPLGNLLLHPTDRLTRTRGLGTLAALPDELLLSHLFSALEGEDLVRCQGTSKAFFAWSRVEGIWKGLYISKTRGRLLRWHGSWRSSYVRTFLLTSDPSSPLPTCSITTPSLHSDVLFQPCLCAAFDARPYFLSSSFVSTIPRISGLNLAPSDLSTEPCILTGLMDSWAALSSPHRRWTLPTLSKRFPQTLFRAEATLTTLPDYEAYHDACAMDESPLYLFDSEYVRKTGLEEGVEGLGDDYEVPQCFKEDLFAVMKDERPDYRWLIVGPTRSGSTWHQDPNGTSAWNAVTTGSKAWIMFPPTITPPGVYVSEDQGQVEAPLSLAEWFMTYQQHALKTYGPKAKDPKLRNAMKQGICRTGEVFFVPSGWWHIVVNLEPSIAVTQNFVSRRELPDVLKFMRDRPEQVSGFKLQRSTSAQVEEDDCDEFVQGVFEKFVEALRKENKEMVEQALNEIGGMKTQVGKQKERGLWEKVKENQNEGFSFGFGGENFGDDLELE